MDRLLLDESGNHDAQRLVLAQNLMDGRALSVPKCSEFHRLRRDNGVCGDGLVARRSEKSSQLQNQRGDVAERLVCSFHPLADEGSEIRGECASLMR
jgi:hypothetical protein